MKSRLWLAAALMMTVTGPVLAQGPGGMGGFQMPPELTKAMEKMRTARKNRMQVGQTIRALAELNKDPKTALKKDQAAKIVKVIDAWKSKPDMSEDQAKQVSKELTAPIASNLSQLKALTVAMQSRGRMGGMGGGGGRMGGGGGGFGGGRPGGGGGFGGGRPGGGGPGGAGGGMGGFDPKAIARRIEDGLKKPYNPMNASTWGDGGWVQRMKDSFDNSVKEIAAKAK